MTDLPFVAGDDSEIALVLVTDASFDAWKQDATPAHKSWVEAHDFKPESARHLILPGEDGAPASVLVGYDPDAPLWTFASLPLGLPDGAYTISLAGEERLTPVQANQLCIGWAMGAYQFTEFKSGGREPARLVLPETADAKTVEITATAIKRCRDLVNRPASHLTPEQLAEEAITLAKAHKAKSSVIVGDKLLSKGYPAIHAVGRAADQPPRLVDVTWGDAKHPHLTIIGKGVTFDTGGLDLKPAQWMENMKKDMGGAAHAIALAGMVMAAGLPVRLRLLLPIVENAVSANAMRPMDIIDTRAGKTVEVMNTDAEGRLILSDALAEAASEEPDLILDYATLTGAARVAMGADVVPFFTHSDAVANALMDASTRLQDPCWRLPLHDGYKDEVKSEIADLKNLPNGPFGGAITAALFLNEFVPPHLHWVHFDTYAWNQSKRPGRPKGGEAMSIRASFEMLRRRYP
ncbi:MAG: leucyl aminopeptidase family protein [Alphaproteobacteria bacterium]